MDEVWNSYYEKSECWSASWLATQDPHGEWPAGVKILEGKMYWAGRLCIPDDLCLRVVVAYHQEWGHIGVNRMVHELRHRFEFPTGFSIRKLAGEVKQACEVCQKTEPPNWQVAQRIDMTPIPPRLFFSVSIDIFSLPSTVWEGQEFDCVVLCVDRLSGWMVAKPSQKLGLTSEKAAHLMMDDGWNILASQVYLLPTRAHSLQGCGGKLYAKD